MAAQGVRSVCSFCCAASLLCFRLPGLSSLTSTPARIMAPPSSASPGRRSPAMRPKMPAQTGSQE